MPKLLGQLVGGKLNPTQHLETQQALVKQLAEILEFVLKFDEYKVSYTTLILNRSMQVCVCVSVCCYNLARFGQTRRPQSVKARVGQAVLCLLCESSKQRVPCLMWEQQPSTGGSLSQFANSLRAWLHF